MRPPLFPPATAASILQNVCQVLELWQALHPHPRLPTCEVPWAVLERLEELVKAAYSLLPAQRGTL